MLIQSTVFGKNMTDIFLELKALLCPRFPRKNLSKVDSATPDQFSYNSICACFIFVFPKPPTWSDTPLL